MKAVSRSTALKIAAVLSFLMGVYNVVATIPLITQGSAAIDVDNKVGVENPPYFILVMGLILGVLAIVAAYGTWKQQRWGIILAIIANAVSGITALPGLIFPAAFSPLWWSAVPSVLIPVLVIVLCLWRGSKTSQAMA